MIALDGSHGEGGGQILRSSLTLSLLTGKPFKLTNIRANRHPPGLRPAHLTAVKAAAEIGQARYKGGTVGSDTLYFEPGTVQSGNYRFAIGTAGATGLVLHTIFLPLALRGTATSRVTITGGTHVNTSPCFHYNAVTWAGYLRKMGIMVHLEMPRAGFYPRGGGELVAQIEPCANVRPVRIMTREPLTTAGGFSAVADLPASIAERQAKKLRSGLKEMEVESHIPTETWSNGPGTVAAVIFRQAPVPTLFFGIGERGKPAEQVAHDAIDQARAYRDSGCPVDPHAADQILLPLTFAEGASEYRVSAVTRHLTTNAEVIRQFVEREMTITGDEGGPGVVRVEA
ncbi:MAG: RNA 3'-terminal phosphate cyclase [Bacteroidales bacterium]|nr:RNA 3'-terminal phosphate cyclase [Bacteroidales bacterium]